MSTTWEAPNARRGAMIERATPCSNGQVGYDVARIGRFTIGYGSHRRHAAHDDTTYLVVTYGENTSDDFYASCTLAHPDAPTLFGITLVGKSVIATEQVMEYLANEPHQRSAWWITPTRHDRSGHLVDVPDRTRSHVAYIVAALVEDFLDRPDAEQLLTAHRHHHAADRAADSRARLAEIDREIALWNQLRHRETAALASQEALARGEDAPPEQASPIHRGPADGRWQPLTIAGERYLRTSGLSADGTTA